ncbi:MAG: MFS transporter [Clostridia bacterium]|nr:MFS transporter [Clostridia bacterium]
MKSKFENLFKVDGKFYYGWVVLLCGFMSMFICYVIKVNCYGLFYNPICEEFGITRTAFTQTNTVMTFAMMGSSLFIGKLYKKFPVKWMLTACVTLTSVCYLLMSRTTALWQMLILAGIQGIGWAGATNLPVTIMVSNWFGPKVKGTAMSIGMLGSGAGALVWVKVINSVIANSGWRAAYLAMAGINALMIPIAILLIVSMPSDKGFETRVGDPSPEETKSAVPLQRAGITGGQALKTGRWWTQWLAGAVTMIGAAAFSAQFVAYFTEVTGDSNQAASIYAGALGTMILGKFLVGVLADVLHIKRVSVLVPIFYAGVFICMAMATKNMIFATILIPMYMLGGALPSTVPFLITSYNFGDKDYGTMSGWMNIAGNVGQIVGPTVAAMVFDITGTYVLAWYIFAALMLVVSALYFISTRLSTKQIAEMGFER